VATRRAREQGGVRHPRDRTRVGPPGPLRPARPANVPPVGRDGLGVGNEAGRDVRVASLEAQLAGSATGRVLLGQGDAARDRLARRAARWRQGDCLPYAPCRLRRRGPAAAGRGHRDLQAGRADLRGRLLRPSG
jgi:hypothetical protein